jgi:hypothetical protein
MREKTPAGIMADVKSVKTRRGARAGGRRRVHAPLRGPGELDRSRCKKRQADPPAYRQRRRARREARVEVGASLLDRRSLRHVTVFEAPDDEALSAHLLEIGSLGNVRTTTLRAYDEEEMSGILQRLA